MSTPTPLTHSLVKTLQAVLLAQGKPLSLAVLVDLFAQEQLSSSTIKQALQQLEQDLADSALELKHLSGGYRIQIRQEYSTYINRLWQERPQRYSRALLETLALIAYKQPATRGEIEDVRGVAVSSQIIRTLQERDWIKVVGHKDVPGRPAMLATTQAFLDYFNLASLAELPPLKEVRDLSAAFEKLQDSLVEPTDKEKEHSSDKTKKPASDSQESVSTSELSFSTLLAELESMETGIKTDFSDITPDEIDASQAQPQRKESE